MRAPSGKASLIKGTSHGLYFTVACTYSHALDDASGLESAGFNGRGVNFIPGYQYLSYGDSNYDARQRLATSYNYEVPLLSSWNDKMVFRETLGGWHISGVTALQTGFPVTIKDEGAVNSLYCNAGFSSYYNCPDTPDSSSGVRVNCICPGDVNTPMVAAYFANATNPAALRAEVYSKYALRRIAEPEEIAEVSLRLDRAQKS